MSCARHLTNITYKEKSMHKKPTRGAPTSRPPEPLPDWLVDSPWNCSYRLTMAEGGFDCQDVQTIDLTRREYFQLKLVLAGMRGLSVPLTQPEDLGERFCETIWRTFGEKEIKAAMAAGKQLAAREVAHA